MNLNYNITFILFEKILIIYHYYHVDVEDFFMIFDDLILQNSNLKASLQILTELLL